MQDYDIVYFKGNPSSGTAFQHEKINKEILSLFESYSHIIMESKEKNLSNIIHPHAKVYIGFSRGSRYLKKLPQNSLKISIGGIKGNNIHLFKNRKDRVIVGDLSQASLNAHFIMEDETKSSIKKLIHSYLLTYA